MTPHQSPAAAFPGWQPIETLPQDGSLVMYHSPAAGCFIAPAHILRDYLKGVQMERLIGPGDAGYVPTHWMPLPPAPETEPDAKGFH